MLQLIFPYVHVLLVGTFALGGEHNGVCSFDVSDALGKLAQLVGEGAHPYVSVWALYDLAVFL